MRIKSTLIRPYARTMSYRVKKDRKHAIRDQGRIFKSLINRAKNTRFGRDHHFSEISEYKDFCERVPIKDYEALRPYFDEVKQGKTDVLWPGKAKYLAKTSGTVSGYKYIPLTKDSIPNHFGTARNAAFHYSVTTGNYSYLDGKVMFLSGSPKLEKKHGIRRGRLSGISNHLVPSWLKTLQAPTYETNCIEDWEEKLDKIIEETHNSDLRMISGIPPWVQMYFEAILKKTGKDRILDIFPNLSIFVYGGVNYEPYRKAMRDLIGGDIDSLETYPASEGFIAFQDRQDSKGLLLNTNSGIFFEFVKADEFHNNNPHRYRLSEVEKNVSYAIIINSNAGLWGYNLGDTVMFTSLAPYRLLVTGRIAHYISAFGEHVIGKEVEDALQNAFRETGDEITELTVAPQFKSNEKEVAYHQWLIEFARPPADQEKLEKLIDASLCRQNEYYKNLRDGNMLERLRIVSLPSNSFRKYMKSIGKLGGQNKVPRLSNDRKIADALLKIFDGS